MFKIKARELKLAIDSVTKSIGAVENIELTVINKTTLKVSAHNADSNASFFTSCLADGNFFCVVRHEIINKICLRRDDLKFELINNEISFTNDGSYQGTFKTETGEALNSEPPEDLRTIESSNDYFVHMAKEYFSPLAISDMQNTGKNLALMIRSNQNNIQLAVTDLLHVAVITSKTPIAINQTLPLLYTSRLLDVLKNEGFYAIGNNRVYAWTNNLHISLPAISELLESWEVVDIMTGLKSPVTRCKIDLNQLKLICHNLQAAHEASNLINLDIKANGVYLTCISSHGTIKDLLPVQELQGSPAAININLSILLDVLGVAPMGVYELKLLPSRNDQLILCLALPLKDAMLSYYVISYAAK